MRIKFEKPQIDELKKENFLVDMHFHTRFSHDSSTNVDLIVKRAKAIGVNVAITDHNQIQGFLSAKKLSPDLVYPAIEICTSEGKEIIPYFYDGKDLREFYIKVVQPKLKTKTSLQSNNTSLSAESLLDALSKENCIVALPHPFAMQPRRSFSFFDSAKKSALLRHIDAVEVLNATMLHRHNLASCGWALKHDKAFIGGSDGHDIDSLGSVFTCAPAQDWEGFLDAIKKKDSFVVGTEHKFGYKMMLATKILQQKARLIKNINMHKKL